LCGVLVAASATAAHAAFTSCGVRSVSCLPVANDDPGLAPPNAYYIVAFGQTLTVPASTGLLANDSGPTNTQVDPGHSDIVSFSGHATLTIQPDGSFTYVPDPAAHYAGFDTFRYEITDGAPNFDTSDAFANIVVVPAVRDDAYNVTENQTLDVAAPGVFANDDIAGLDVTTLANDPFTVHGVPVTVNTDGSFSYTPPADFTGVDTFTYKIMDWDNDNTYSATVTLNVVPPPPVPDAPTDVSATAGDASASVSWTAAGDNGSAITEYTITASPGGAVATVDGSQTAATVTGLTNGTTYTFTVAATNAFGTGAASAPSNAVTPAGLPSIPTNVHAATVGTTATVTWTGSAGNGSPITSYTVSASPGGASTVVDGSTTAGQLPGLTYGTTYTFTVTATNGVGTCVPSLASNAVTPTAPPDPPTNVHAVTAGTTATVSWSAPAQNNGSAISSYTVTRNPGGATTTVPATQTNALVAPLSYGVQYTFTVHATNGAGNSIESAVSNAVVPDDGHPPVPTMTAPTAATALALPFKVSWTATDVSGIAHYDVQRQVDAWNAAPAAWTSWLTNTSATSATYTGNYGYTFCFRVRAQDRAGNLSGFSAPRCTAVPLKSSQLVYSAGWTHQNLSTVFGGVFYTTKVHGARATRTGIHARQLFLVATECSTCGTVQVLWNGAVIKTVNLHTATTLRKQVIGLATFASVRTGTLTIIDFGPTGRPVILEGLMVGNH
jgi:hypothetical protein